MTARDAAAHAGDAASFSLPDMTLDQLDDDVTALARAYCSTSPVEMYRRAKELLGLSQALLERTQKLLSFRRCWPCFRWSGVMLVGRRQG